MRLKYAHLCDYITSVQGGKPAMIGVWDMFAFMGARNEWEPLAIPHAFLIVSLACSAADPDLFTFEYRLVNDDGKTCGSWTTANVSIATEPGAEPGLERTGFAWLELVNITVPAPGDYVWEFYADGVRLGQIEMGARHKPPSLTVQP